MSAATAESAHEPRAPAGELDVFLSYSRRDSRFVARLAKALQARGRSVWIDKDAIPPGAPWRQELGTAIEAASVFVFVISPDSVNSTECAAELARAVELNKRLVPILHRDDPDVPAVLMALQYIQIHDERDFPAGLELVERAIDTDHDWVRAHTHWGARALRWAERGGDRSVLARGGDLRAAEEWLAGQGRGSGPPPTQLQADFVLASRQVERRRLRTLVGAALTAVAISASLAVVALLQRTEAIEQRNQAYSRELAAHAVIELSSDPERSLLLAVEGDQIVRTPQTVDALRRALSASRVRASMRGHRGSVIRALFVAGGDRIATGSRDGTARLWSRGGRSLAIMRHHAPLRGLAATADGRVLATASEDGTARIWDGRSGRAITTLRGHRGKVSSAALDRDGRIAVTAGDDGTVRVWNAHSGVQRAVLRGHRGAVGTAALSLDGRHVVSGGDDGTTRLWTVRSQRARVVQRHGYPVDNVEFSGTGREALTLTQDGVATIWRVRTWKPSTTITDVFSAAMSADGKSLVTGSHDGTAKVWPSRGSDVRSELRGHGETVLGTSLTADGKLAATSGVDHTARVWDTATGRSLAVLRGHTGFVHHVHFSRDARMVLTASGDGTARRWDVGQPLELRGHGSRRGPTDLDVWSGRAPQVTGAEMSPDGRHVISSSRDVTAPARLWDRVSGRELYAPPGCRRPDWWVKDSPWVSCISDASMNASGGAGILNDVRWSPEGRRVVAVGDYGPYVFDPFSGRVLAELRGHKSEVHGARFSADGKHIVTAGKDGTARVWRASDGRQLALLQPQETPRASKEDRALVAAAFSPDGRRIATAGYDGTVRIFDAERGTQTVAHRINDGIVLDVDWSADGRHIAAPTGNAARVWKVNGWRRAAVMRGHDGLVSTSSFSADASLLITGGYDGTARVWDVADGEQVTALPGHAQTVTSARIDETKRYLVTGSEDGTVLVHRCEACGAPDELKRLARQHITRNLTSEERRRYLAEPST